jgi:hypothetical protein
MDELAKEEFKKMYEELKAKESIIKNNIANIDSERKFLKESIKRQMESLS